jgi:hypothetical protein
VPCALRWKFRDFRVDVLLLASLALWIWISTEPDFAANGTATCQGHRSDAVGACGNRRRFEAVAGGASKAAERHRRCSTSKKSRNQEGFRMIRRLTSVALLMNVLAFSPGCTAPEVGSENGPNPQAAGDPLADDGKKTDAAEAPASPPTDKHSLTVTLNGPGAGNITSTPSGLTCAGNTCKGSFPVGTTVTLTATPNPSSFFTAWTGKCTGTTSCALEVGDDVQVGAQFSNFDGTTWTGTYTGQQHVGNCIANNAGDVVLTFTQKGSALSSQVDMTGIDMRNTRVCSTAGMTSGSSDDSPMQMVGATIFGSWSVAASGPTSKFSYPFIAQISGNTIKGSWTCTNCPGEFTLTKRERP